MTDNTLQELLDLSRIHLQLTREENWDRWEDIASKKEALHRKMTASGTVIDKNSQTVLEISKLEKELFDLIKQKRDEVKTRLLEVRRSKKAISVYKKAGLKKGNYHLGISC
jgi:hypothetical protein